jgi:hypothetical protein
MHRPTIDAVLSMLDTVESEYRATYATTADPYEQAQALARKVSTERIRREVLILAGRSSEPVLEGDPE